MMRNKDDYLIYQQRPYSVVPENKYTLLYVSILVAALGGFILGYDTVLISGALIFVRDFFSLDTRQIEILVSSILLSGILGAALGWPLSLFFGRKKAMIISAVLFLIGTLLVIKAPFFPLIILGRLVTGLGLGIVSMSALIYLSEIVPPNIRGSSVCLFNFVYNLGVFSALLVGAFFAYSGAWRWILASSIVPAAIYLIFLFKIPDTPLWYTKVGQKEKANKTLKLLRRGFDVQAEMESIEETLKHETHSKGKFWSKGVVKSLLIGIAVAFFMEITGMDAIFYYAPLLLKRLGAESTRQSIFSGLIITSSSLLFSFLAILFIDLWGRRKLLLTGLSIMVVSLVILGILFGYGKDYSKSGLFMVLSFVFYAAGFSLGIGTVGWLLISEIFPLKIRSFAVSFCITIKWLANYSIARTFLGTVDLYGIHRTFWFYSLVSLFAWVFVYFLVPETRGRSLEKIEEFWLTQKRHGTEIES